MAVITAHGGVHPEGRYFQVVSDEGSLRVTAGDLANALRNVGIVILFVCSGGRADKHPGGEHYPWARQADLGSGLRCRRRFAVAARRAGALPLAARVPAPLVSGQEADRGEFLGQSGGRPEVLARSSTGPGDDHLSESWAAPGVTHSFPAQASDRRRSRALTDQRGARCGSSCSAAFVVLIKFL